ncbi:MAG: low affinity iron permease family protein [Cyanobacteria bacterium]|nr:low affinity iron permease family protein [Cyanobacteriota bacterium]
MQNTANLNNRASKTSGSRVEDDRTHSLSSETAGQAGAEGKLERKSGFSRKVDKAFAHFAKVVASASGKPITFFLACLLLILWALSGPTFDFNDTWQLVINTGTTIITFLMVFVIQNTQNRDMEAMQIKLDEIMEYIGDTNRAIMGAEDLSTDELESLRQNYVDNQQEKSSDKN